MSTSRDSIDAGNTSDQPRHDWTRAESEALHDLPFADLIFRAQGIHRRNFDPNHVETASLLSIKTGGCPEDCGYCSQSAHYETGVKATRLMDRSAVVATARRARDAGASRFCMAAAWRNPKDKDLDRVCEMVAAVKELGMETCATLGMLTGDQARRLRGWISTITMSTPRRNSTARSSQRAPCRIASIRSAMPAKPDSRSAAAASWEWENKSATAWAC
jgi:biotin synthase